MEKRMTEQLSLKLKILSFISIVMVLYIHTYYTEGANMVTLSIIETFIGQRICLIAVPLFYAISGYLFFLKVPYGFVSIKQKLKKRVYTLLVPYLIANILTFLFYVSLNLIIKVITSLDAIVNFKIFSVMSQGFWPTLELIFLNPPIAFQLWFLRDLMLIMLFSQILYYAFLYICKFEFRIYFIIMILLLASYVFINHHLLVALVWFSVGGLLAMYPQITITNVMPKLYEVAFYISFIILLFVSNVFELPLFFYKLIPVFGIPVVWSLFDRFAFIFRSNSIFIQRMCPYTFFIYITHEPLLNIFKKNTFAYIK